MPTCVKLDKWMYVNCWQSFSGSEKGHIAQGNNIVLYGWTVLGKFRMI